MECLSNNFIQKGKYESTNIFKLFTSEQIYWYLKNMIIRTK
jgi:hypothetical protein